MEWFRIMALVSAAICLITALYHFLRLVRTGKPVDYALKAGDTRSAVIYSLTGAMNPRSKESACLHLPAYIAGILYHLGTFLSMFLFVLLISGIQPSGVINLIIAFILGITAAAGILILVRRFLNTELRLLSNPDDYISNILVTLFHAGTIAVLHFEEARIFYFVEVSLLLLYFPVGKLRHTVYFFAARYQLGYFFGYRGTWPPVKLKS